MLNDGVIPLLPLLPLLPLVPFDPLTKPKFKIGLVVVPDKETVGLLPLAKLVTVPILNEGVIPLVPLVPFVPLTRPKLKTPDVFNVTYGVPVGPKFVTLPTLNEPIPTAPKLLICD